MLKRTLFSAAAAISFSVSAPAAFALGAEPYIGEIGYTAGTFCPLNWMEADGRLLLIAQHSALFSLLGKSFGGDGTTNFAVPDLRGRFPVGTGPNVNLGESFGAESTKLSTRTSPVVSGSGKLAPAAAGQKTDVFAAVANPNIAPVETLPPFVVMTACIATKGVFPMQN